MAWTVAFLDCSSVLGSGVGRVRDLHLLGVRASGLGPADPVLGSDIGDLQGLCLTGPCCSQARVDLTAEAAVRDREGSSLLKHLSR